MMYFNKRAIVHLAFVVGGLAFICAIAAVLLSPSHHPTCVHDLYNTHETLVSVSAELSMSEPKLAEVMRHSINRDGRRIAHVSITVFVPYQKDSFSEVPTNKKNEMLDAWGQPILLVEQADGSLVVASQGPNKTWDGGRGDDITEEVKLYTQDSE